MYKKRMNHKEVKKLVLKVVADCRGLAADHIRNWQPVNETWQTIEGAVYLRLSDDTQVAVERGSLEQQIHIAISEAQYRSEQEKVNYRITEFYIEPGITGTHGNRPLLPPSCSTSGYSTISALRTWGKHSFNTNYA